MLDDIGIPYPENKSIAVVARLLNEAMSLMATITFCHLALLKSALSFPAKLLMLAALDTMVNEDLFQGSVMG